MHARTHTHTAASLARTNTHACTQDRVSGADRQQLADLESLLCGTLQSLLRKISKPDVLAISDSVVQALLVMFQASAGQAGGVQEDAIMTVGVLVEGLDSVLFHLLSTLSNRGGRVGGGVSLG